MCKIFHIIFCRVKVPKRNGSTSCPFKGIFAGAKVVRGPDWDWGNQDGKCMKSLLVSVRNFLAIRTIFSDLLESFRSL